MSLLTQAKILRVLQEKEIQRVGGSERIKTDVRLIVATNKDLEKAISENKFREDLYYRLNVVTINLPPLRDRKEDIKRLAQYFIRRFSAELKRNVKGYTEESLVKLTNYSWPGNIRELENIIKRAVVECKGDYIMPDHLHLDYKAEKARTQTTQKDVEAKLEYLLDQVFNEIAKLPKEKGKSDITSIIEKSLIIKALKMTSGNQMQAANILGINRNTLRSKMGQYKIKKVLDVVKDAS